MQAQAQPRPYHAAGSARGTRALGGWEGANQSQGGWARGSRGLGPSLPPLFKHASAAAQMMSYAPSVTCRPPPPNTGVLCRGLSMPVLLGQGGERATGAHGGQGHEHLGDSIFLYEAQPGSDPTRGAEQLSALGARAQVGAHGIPGGAMHHQIYNLH